MSLLKWKELAKSETELGNKINYVHDAIMKHNIGQKTSQESFSKVFKPVTSKLDDVIESNLNLRSMPQRKKRPPNKVEEGIDYAPEVDPFEDMEIDDLFGDYVPPQQEKQLVPKPPTYEESLADLLEGKKEIYVDPQYFSQDLQELPPEYDDNEEVDYGLDDEHLINNILDDLGIPNYGDVEMRLEEPEMTDKKTKAYLKKILKNAMKIRQSLTGYKADVTKKFNSGMIGEAEKQERNKMIDLKRKTLNGYIDFYGNTLKAMKGSGIKGRGRKQRGGNIMFFNDVKQLLKKLELIIGEILAGNTGIKMRNTGVAILDMLLMTATINRPQYNKIYNNYFKI